MLKEISVYITCCRWRKEVAFQSEELRDLQFSDVKFDNVKKYTYAITEFTLEYLSNIKRHNNGIRLEVILCGTRKMIALNKAYRGLNKSTNVLSFSQIIKNSENNDELIGDLYICHKPIVDEISELNVTFLHRFTQLIVHGILHITGYDHDNKSSADEMELIEDMLMNKIGFSKFY
ncbi:rRNA maturation RNase YbeY [Candidatus Fokinia crypta]|uniref:Endoribonuclease YbeY n=1 Tax=Candidatus Fokinia crypta TaxID=1920990 RepID=A0ABZ0UPZ4_9RICK|nr:rRNA maturation RNase YbeY [Candidatus Fokinia cryptica]WPX97747.1 Endoribonuclease YbeY [Candidatus Fokinia cryptica]